MPTTSAHTENAKNKLVHYTFGTENVKYTLQKGEHNGQRNKMPREQ